ncbi:MAG: hypothetical protein M0P58_07410, partial [Bacteroidales bacterium]|nr:hypothetical protein [Bacteroidales bacterium]
KARLQGKSLEEMIHEDAAYVFYSNFNTLEGKSYADSIDYIIMNIRNNADWLALVEKKARDQQVPLDTIMRRDAVYTYEQSKKKP